MPRFFEDAANCFLEMVYVDMFCASVGLSTTYGTSIFVWFLALCPVVVFLGWQNSLDQSVFKLLEVCGRVAAEPPALRPHRLAPFQPRAQLAPSLPVRRRQVLAPHLAPQASRQRRRQPHRTAHHQPRRCHLPAARPTLVVAMRPEELLQVVVRPRQVGPIISSGIAPASSSASPSGSAPAPRPSSRPARRAAPSHPAGPGSSP